MAADTSILERGTITIRLPDRWRRRYVKPQTVNIEVLLDPTVSPEYCPNCDGITNPERVSPSESYKLEGYGCCCN